ncbi:CobW family GTP-binding protein [Paraburkholderia sp. D1E]|uniref:CobW family GTP-binding protein n=1 Tax=Paraburkholderia sp. D1E TaxID=3461398 RepID=UPI00404572A8
MVWVPEGHFDRHLPLGLLTGFLGSGKTTLLNQLLRDPRMADTAIAINEFGDVGLDQHFVEGQDDDVILLANGCMCCLAGEQIEQSLARIFRRSATGELPQFKRLLIETSGLADPEYVLQSILDNPVMSRFLWLDSIVTTVDSLFGLQQIDQHHEAAKQARLADKLVITKADMVDADALTELRDTLGALNPRAAQITKTDDEVDLSTLFSATFFDEREDVSLLGNWAESFLASRGDSRHAYTDTHAHAHGQACTHACKAAWHGYKSERSRHARHASTVTLTADFPLEWHSFVLWLGSEQRRYGDRLLRVKGILNVTGTADPVVIHAIQSVLHAPVSLKKWPQGRIQSNVVFILDGHDHDLHGSWAAHLDTLRN